VAQSADGIDFARVLGHGHVEVSLVAAEDGAVFPLPARTEVRLDPVDGSEDEVVPVLVTEVRVDPRKAAAGHRLRPGLWRLRARPAIGGFTNHVDRLRVGGRRRRRPVRFLVTADGRLAPPPGSARRLLRSAPGPVRRLATHAER
jgi:hypothetical protein